MDLDDFFKRYVPDYVKKRERIFNNFITSLKYSTNYIKELINFEMRCIEGFLDEALENYENEILERPCNNNMVNLYEKVNSVNNAIKNGATVTAQFVGDDDVYTINEVWLVYRNGNWRAVSANTEGSNGWTDARTITIKR